MAQEQGKDDKPPAEELSDKKEESAAETKPEELVVKKEDSATEKQPEELTDKKEETTDKKPTELDQKTDEKSESEIKAEELAAKKKAAAAAQCDDVAKWVKEKCPSCPPIPRMFLYSIPIFTALPLLYRRFFCPPKCLRIGKCSKIYPGCCEPENRCNKPPCCSQR